MKKLYLALIISLFSLTHIWAQHNVTFQVDMNNQTVSTNGVHVAGNFQIAAGYASDWAPNLTQLTDANNDGIYNITVNIPAGYYEYKYINGNAWGQDESVPGACATNNNRAFTVASDTTLTAFCFGTCQNLCNPPLDTLNLTFSVDMRDEFMNNGSNGSVHVAGNFQANAGFGNDWTPNTTPLTDNNNDSIFETTVQVTKPVGQAYNFEYKYINGNAWGQDEGIPAACAINNNRGASITTDTVLPAFCFATCNTLCAPLAPTNDTINLTFQVDMRTEFINTGASGTIGVAGSFQQDAGFPSNWSPGVVFLTDTNNDSIFNGSVQIITSGGLPYTFQYKYIKGATFVEQETVPTTCGVSDGFGGFNREASVSSDTVLSAICFSECSNCTLPTPPVLDTFNVTFNIDMRNNYLANGLADTIAVAGSFQSETNLNNDWIADSTLLTDANNDSIYSATVQIINQGSPFTFQYKYLRNNTYEAVPSTCGASDGFGGFNREISISGDTVLSAICFAECDTCTLPTPPTTDTFDITFQVNMKDIFISNGSSGTVSVAGSFQNDAGFGNDWTPGTTTLTDANTDSIYTTTIQVEVTAGNNYSFQYKYLNGNTWGTEETVPSACGINDNNGGYNRSANITSDTVLNVVCFSGCTNCNTPLPTNDTVDVTFRVNMKSAQSISALGVHVAGSFQGLAGFGSDWNPASTPLTDANTDSIYTITVRIPTGTYQYKFINGNTFNEVENVPNNCGIADGFGGFNRSTTITSDTVLEAVCFSTCITNCVYTPPAPTYPVTFQVDMATEIVSANGVHIAGNFQTALGLPNNWEPNTVELTDPDLDGIYTVTVNLPADTFQYKFINGNTFNEQETVPNSCGIDDGFGNYNRRIITPANAYTVPEVCFATCQACQTDTFNVTFQVDMREDFTTNGISDTVSVAGNFQADANGVNWTPGTILLTDANTDSIYQTTVQVIAKTNGTYNFDYKYLNGGTWGSDENLPISCSNNGNRTATITSDTTLPAYCFSTCNVLCAPINTNTINVTFRVNMKNALVNTNGIFVTGNFNNLNWSTSSLQLTDNNNLIYERIVAMAPSLYHYKYANGNTIADLETANFNTLGCGSIDSLVGEVRVLNLTGTTNDTILPVYLFNSCMEDTVGGTPPNSILSINQNTIKAFPNPFNNKLFLSFENTQANYSITVTTLTGKTVISQQTKGQAKLQLNTTHLTQGIYFLTITHTQTGQFATSKIVAR